MIDKSLIEKLIEEKLEGTGCFIVEVLIRSGNRIYVFIDSDTGVTIEDCVAVSRHIEGNVDREVEDYELQVSSAGLDMPLRIVRQYIKNKGKFVDVVLADGEKITGTLLDAGNESFQILVKGNKKAPGDKTIELKYNEIKETKIKLIF